jgi:hypothetical protein
MRKIIDSFFVQDGIYFFQLVLQRTGLLGRLVGAKFTDLLQSLRGAFMQRLP